MQIITFTTHILCPTVITIQNTYSHAGAWSWDKTQGEANACCFLDRLAEASRIHWRATAILPSGSLHQQIGAIRHISALKELLKEPNNRNLIKPMLLDFEDSHDANNDEVQENGKGKTKMDEEDLSKPFKEILKCPFTRRIVEFSSPGHRMPTNVKTNDGTGDPEDNIGRFVGAGKPRRMANACVVQDVPTNS
ncbi:hypothetical protein Tco_0472505 [Tanacetum coccineum]